MPPRLGPTGRTVVAAQDQANAETWMRRALELAERGRGSTSPNPMVGAVLLRDGEVVGEGFHQAPGEPHAEALALLQAGARAAGATCYVTLEPCAHHGRTPPCADALIAAGVVRVVAAIEDPDPHVRGQGFARLRAAGVEVELGPGAAAAEAQNAAFLLHRRLGRPRVTLKAAASLDGKVAAADGSSQWITGPEARADVHRRRAEHGAVLVGTGTVLADDPALTARDGDALLPWQPLPVVAGRRPVPDGAAVRRHPGPLLQVPTHEPQVVLDAVAEAGARSLLVEGGPTVASAFLAAGLADEVLAYLAPTLLGGDRTATGDLGVATITDQRRLTVRAALHLGDDLLVVARPAPSGA
jgi:diaminohydroxyphosphoribosylaminopyrimidine deaminase/5-amino-6-(5-phosphoribosylamino)uracil reductase